MTSDELKTILNEHAKWARGDGGKRANLDGANLDGANLAGANLADANLAGANLARAYLAGANLAGANLDGANLARANLAGANLDGANLARANLADANLARANLVGAYLADAKLSHTHVAVGLIARVTRIIEPYEFFAWRTNKGDIVKAGCRFLTIEQFRAHVAKEYPGTAKAEETLAILDFIEARYKAIKL